MRKCLAVFICLMAMPLLAACMGKSELSDTVAAVGIGIDAAENGELLLSVEIADRSIEAGMQSGDGSGRCFSVYTEDLPSAHEEMQKQIDKQVYSSGVMVMVFGADVDPRHIVNIARTVYISDIFNDDLLLLSAEGRAEDVLAAEFGTAAYVSQGLHDALDDYSLGVSISDFVSKAEQGINLSLPVVYINSDGMAELL